MSRFNRLIRCAFHTYIYIHIHTCFWLFLQSFAPVFHLFIFRCTFAKRLTKPKPLERPVPNSFITCQSHTAIVWAMHKSLSHLVLRMLAPNRYLYFYFKTIFFNWNETCLVQGRMIFTKSAGGMILKAAIAISKDGNVKQLSGLWGPQILVWWATIQAIVCIPPSYNLPKRLGEYSKTTSRHEKITNESRTWAILARCFCEWRLYFSGLDIDIHTLALTTFPWGAKYSSKSSSVQSSGRWKTNKLQPRCNGFLEVHLKISETHFFAFHVSLFFSQNWMPYFLVHPKKNAT